MQINVYPFPSAVAEKQYFGKTVVVIDVLRATTSMIEALNNGAIQIVPARDAGEAMALAARLDRSERVIAGESGGHKLPGFGLGNSPFDFSRSEVSGKTIVLTTSNGTGAIRSASTASHLLIGSLRNRKAVAKKALEFGEDVIIVCAGTDGEASLDDMAAAGSVLSTMLNALEDKPEVNDFARVCVFLYDSWKSGAFDLELAGHLKHLNNIGFERDIAYCLEEDKTDRVPIHENGSIR